MAKDLSDQQRTDARRIGRGGSGKLDQDDAATARAGARPAPRREGARTSARSIAAVRERLDDERRQAILQLERIGLTPNATETEGRLGAGSIVEEGDAAQASERRDLAFMTRERLANRINRLTAALRRIEEGSYGRCEVCGEEIEPERLAALPEATTCLRCQEARERGDAA